MERKRQHITSSPDDPLSMTTPSRKDSVEIQQHLDSLNAWFMLAALHTARLPKQREDRLLALLDGIGPNEELTCLEMARYLEKDLVTRWQTSIRAQQREQDALPAENWYRRQAESEAEQELVWFRARGILIDDPRYYDFARSRYILPCIL